ncbi:MAG: D-alanine--D-alanyl carrier protein ligase [Legionellaceae bacterium]
MRDLVYIEPTTFHKEITNTVYLDNKLSNNNFDKNNKIIMQNFLKKIKEGITIESDIILYAIFSIYITKIKNTQNCKINLSNQASSKNNNLIISKNIAINPLQTFQEFLFFLDSIFNNKQNCIPTNNTDTTEDVDYFFLIDHSTNCIYIEEKYFRIDAILQKDDLEIKVKYFDIENNNYCYKNIKTHLESLINSILKEPEKQIGLLNILSDNEYNSLTKRFNNTTLTYGDSEKTIDILFEEQVIKTPDNIAIRFNDTAYTYEELNKKANTLAYTLQVLNIRPNDVVGLYVDKNCEMIVSILGILKAGGAYLPLDTSYPYTHLQYMLENSKSKYLITSSNLKDNFTNFEGEIILLDKLNLDSSSKISHKKSTTVNNLVYVLYTSGSTGKPKGVAVSHRALNNHMMWMKNQFNFSEKDVFLQKTPLSFDASIWEIFMPLIIGAEMALSQQDAHMDPMVLYKDVNKYKATILQLVPTLLNELLINSEKYFLRTIKKFFVGGESLTTEIREKYFKIYPNVTLTNLYGPTETTIETSFHICENKKEELTKDIIGKPISNMRLYILDKQQQLLPAGCIGELYVAGVGLAEGYLNQPLLTNERFIKNSISPDFCEKIYKTGDLARWSTDGKLEYIGRLNTEVKIRGKRIDIHYIESCLVKHQYIKKCVVTTTNDESGSQILVAYFSLQRKKKIFAKDLKIYLSDLLPDFMIPNLFVKVDHFPLTPSGKLDKLSLPDPFLYRLPTGQEYYPLETDTEKLIGKIWKKLLKVKKIGKSDNFFHIGGYSLMAIQFLCDINELLDINLTVKHIFEHPTPSELGMVIDNLLHKTKEEFNEYSPIIKLNDKNNKTAIFFIHPVGGTVFWFKTLSRYLDNEFTIYGIQDSALDIKDHLYKTIPELAKFYLMHIEAIQKKGPYFIGGASFGSNIAIEIAALLEKKNEKVDFLPIFDGWAYYPEKLKNEDYFKNIMNRQRKALEKDFMEKGIKNTEYLFTLQQYRLLSLWNYTPSRIHQKITLFKASELLPEYIDIDTSLNYWDNYINKNLIDLQIVPGNHESMFYEPHVQILAEKINTILQEIVKTK